MINKTSILLLIMLLLLTAGCEGQKGRLPVNGESGEKSELMEGFQENITSGPQNKSSNEDITELRHWKNGINTGDASKAVYSLTTDEMDRIVYNLVTEGYLEENVRDMTTIQKAIVQYQNDHGISEDDQIAPAVLDVLSK